MNDIEKYFRDHKSELKNLEQSPSGGFDAFSRRLEAAERASRPVRRIAMRNVSIAAAIAVIALVINWKAPAQASGKEYLECYIESISPLYDEVCKMEAENTLCSSMALSSSMKALLTDAEDFAASADACGIDLAEDFCDTIGNDYVNLYAECVRIFNTYVQYEN